MLVSRDLGHARQIGGGRPRIAAAAAQPQNRGAYCLGNC